MRPPSLKEPRHRWVIAVGVGLLVGAIAGALIGAFLLHPPAPGGGTPTVVVGGVVFHYFNDTVLTSVPTSPRSSPQTVVSVVGFGGANFTILENHAPYPNSTGSTPPYYRFQAILYENITVRGLPQLNTERGNFTYVNSNSSISDLSWLSSDHEFGILFAGENDHCGVSLGGFCSLSFWLLAKG
jgi:hypothetical protein